MVQHASTVEELISILQGLDPKARLIADGPDIGGYDVTELPLVGVSTSTCVASLNHKLEGSFVRLGGDHVESHDPDNHVYGKDWSDLVDDDPNSVCIHPHWCRAGKDCTRNGSQKLAD